MLQQILIKVAGTTNNVISCRLYHLDLSLHRDDEEGDEVHDEDGPEDRDVEELEEGAAEADERRLRRRVPELELGQPPDEGAELLVLPRRQRQPVVC